MNHPMQHLWWLSFADERGFLGAALVEGFTIVDAAQLAWELKINPGGQVAGWIISPADYAIYAPHKHRLLSEAEALERGLIASRKDRISAAESLMKDIEASK